MHQNNLAYSEDLQDYSSDHPHLAVSHYSVKREPVLPHIPKKTLEPSVQEVLNLGSQIGIEEKYLDRIYQETRLGGQNYWWAILHDLGHYAVKDDEYIHFWNEYGAPGSVPNLNFTRGNPGEIFEHPYQEKHPCDDTPNEQGVIAWTLGVLELKAWTNPVECRLWREYCAKWEKDRGWQWTPKGASYKKELHPRGDGFQQLKAAGISFSKQNLSLRPTVKSKIGSQPIARLDWRIA